MTGHPMYQRLFAEMKRRRVFRVMALYGVVGFVVLQVVDLAVPALLLSEWTYRFVAFLLLIGFPVAIVLAWAYERTPEGVQRTRPASAEEIQRTVAAPAAQRWPIGLAALFWVRVDPDTALDRLEQLTSDPTDSDVRWEWYQMLQDSAFDVLRDHPRYLEMNARFGL